MTTSEGGVAAGSRRRDVTVAGIARLAGVSAPTVSKVINGRAGVSTSTRQRVEDIIRVQGYRRHIRAEPTPIVEIAFEALDSLWALEIIRGVDHVVWPHGLSATVTEMHGRQTPDWDWVRRVVARRPVGMISVSVALTADQRVQFASRAIPVVTLDPFGEPAHQGPSVGATNWNGGLAAARHLLELGHRRVAMINGPGEFVCCRARSDGYRAALDAAGVPLDPGLLRVAPLYAEGGLVQARHLLGRPSPPTAVFTANDLQALGVYQAAREAGLRIPQDLSVVGFDDLTFVQWLGPPLTTVRQPLLQMGATAAGFVMDLAAGRQPEHDRIELPTTLTVRESTARPAPGR